MWEKNEEKNLACYVISHYPFFFFDFANFFPDEQRGSKHKCLPIWGGGRGGEEAAESLERMGWGEWGAGRGSKSGQLQQQQQLMSSEKRRNGEEPVE